MIFTICIYFLSIIILLTSKISANSRLKLICFFFTLHAALRYDYGWDYFNYVQLINTNQYHRFEPILYIIADISSSYHPQIFFIITSMIIGLCIYGIYKNLDKKIPMLLIGFSLFFFLPIGFLISLDKIRQFVSIFILLYATSCEKNKTRILYITFAIFSHYASLIYVPFVLFPKVLKIKIPRSIIIFLCIISYTTFPPLFELLANSIDRYSEYIELYSSNQGNKLLLLYILIGCIFLFQYKRITKNEYCLYYMNLFFIGLIIYLAFSKFGIHLTRVAYFPLLPTPIIIGYLLKNRNKMYQVLCLLISAILVLLSHYYASFDQIRDPLNNYDLFFFHNLS